MKRLAAGFTLIELLIVIALIALASSVVTLALRDPASSQLEREAVRLAAMLESARAQSRALGQAVNWVPSAEPAGGTRQADFQFVGLASSSDLSTHWLAPGVSATVVGGASVVLGPEPLIGAQRITLSLEDRRVTLATDGIGPFTLTGDGAGDR